MVLASAPVAVQAQGTVDADSKFNEAQDKLANGDYAEALAVVEEGLAANPGHLELLRLRGTILFSRRDFENALNALEAYLAAGPTGANQRKVKKLVASLQLVRETFLQITVPNGPAEIYLESKEFGVFCVAAPDCKKGVMPGDYRVYVTREGFKPVTERIKVAPRKTKEVTVTLQELPSALVIEVTPESAEISLDGKVLGTGRQELEISPGDHALVITASGHAPLEQTVTAAQGKPVEVRASLKQLIAVSVSVPGAQLFLNGEPVTAVDGKILVDPGAHTLTIKAGGYIDQEVEIPAERPLDYQVEVTLAKVPPPPPPRQSSWNASKTAAVATTGALAALGYGATVVFALKASQDWSDARERCDDSGPGVVCGPEDHGLVEDARSAEATANLTFALGTAAGVGVLWAINMNEQPQDSGRMSLTRKVSIGAAAGVGAAGLAVGIVYGLRAASQRSDSEEHCDENLVCDREGFVAATEALDSADISNLGFAVAAVAAGGAALLWWQAPGAERASADPGALSGRAAPAASVQITPTATPEQIGVSVLGRF